MNVTVTWSWKRNGEWIIIHTVAHASSGTVATTDRWYRREPEDDKLSDFELAVFQAEKATEDVKGRFGVSTVKLTLKSGLHDLSTTQKTSISAR